MSLEPGSEEWHWESWWEGEAPVQRQRKAVEGWGEAVVFCRQKCMQHRPAPRVFSHGIQLNFKVKQQKTFPSPLLIPEFHMRAPKEERTVCFENCRFLLH